MRKPPSWLRPLQFATSVSLLALLPAAQAQDAKDNKPKGAEPVAANTSYMPVIERPFDEVFKEMSRGKKGIMNRQTHLLRRATTCPTGR